MISYVFETTTPDAYPTDPYNGRYQDNSSTLSVSFINNGFNWVGDGNTFTVENDICVGTSYFIDQLSIYSTNSISSSEIGGCSPEEIRVYFSEEVVNSDGSQAGMPHMLESDEVPMVPFNYEEGSVYIYFD